MVQSSGEWLHLSKDFYKESKTYHLKHTSEEGLFLKVTLTTQLLKFVFPILSSPSTFSILSHQHLIHFRLSPYFLDMKTGLIMNFKFQSLPLLSGESCEVWPKPSQSRNSGCGCWGTLLRKPWTRLSSQKKSTEGIIKAQLKLFSESPEILPGSGKTIGSRGKDSIQFSSSQVYPGGLA